ncbi:MAG: ATP-binding domain-containing protein, partial [Deltaproteobacteria bacterium]|nr:ATP-binding domain-containing protein [Deltaproteobacteria bacterium]
SSSIPYEFVRRLEEKDIDRLIARLRCASLDTNLSALVEREAAGLGFDEGLITRLTEGAKDYDLLDPCEAMTRFIEEIILREPEDDIEVEASKVSVMTLHQAKGMEFSVVFIAVLNEGLIPLKAADIEEERRLFYVGMTRAKERLYLLHAKKRRLWAEVSESPPSRFLNEVPQGLISVMATEKRKQRKPVQRRLFD